MKNKFHIKIPKLYSQLSDIVNKNFADGEVKLDLLIEMLSLFYILEDGTVFFLEKVTNITTEKDIASFCFYSNNTKTLNLFATKDEYKKQKYGKTLLGMIISKIGKCILHVRISNFAAIKLYEGLKFQKICQIKDFYHETNKNEDAYMMEYDDSWFF